MSSGKLNVFMTALFLAQACLSKPILDFSGQTVTVYGNITKTMLKAQYDFIAKNPDHDLANDMTIGFWVSEDNIATFAQFPTVVITPEMRAEAALRPRNELQDGMNACLVSMRKKIIETAVATVGDVESFRHCLISTITDFSAKLNEQRGFFRRIADWFVNIFKTIASWFTSVKESDAVNDFTELSTDFMWKTEKATRKLISNTKTQSGRWLGEKFHSAGEWFEN